MCEDDEEEGEDRERKRWGSWVTILEEDENKVEVEEKGGLREEKRKMLVRKTNRRREKVEGRRGKEEEKWMEIRERY